jgi:S-methylmethionine-dependent homocysteine/selenocysteine methylase
MGKGEGEDNQTEQTKGSRRKANSEAICIFQCFDQTQIVLGGCVEISRSDINQVFEEDLVPMVLKTKTI